MPLSRRTLITASAPIGLGGLLATTGCFASDASESGRLVFAALGFLGLGAGTEAPEWGASLARPLPYLERAPLAALAPVAALIALTLAVMAAVSTSRRTTRR